MEKWTWLIVPVTMFVLFVLSQIMKREEDKPRPRRQPQPRRDPSEPQQDQRSEMQRFLDEVQRLRDRAEQKKQETAAPWSPPPRPMPPVVQVVRQPQRAKEAVRAVKREEVLEVVPADVEAERTPRMLAEVSRSHLPKPKPQSAAARQMLALLRSPSSLATAVLLKEVLDRPLCLRRERRGMTPQ